MKKLICTLALVLVSAVALFAQVTVYPYHEIALGNQNGFAKILTNASITVCTDLACSHQATVYNASSAVLTQPLSTDANGNYSFYALCGFYWEKVEATGFTTKIVPIYVPCVSGGGGGGSITLETNGTANGSQTLLNLQQMANVGLNDTGSGTVYVSAIGGPNLIPDGDFALFASGSLAPKWTSSGACTFSLGTFNSLPAQNIACTGTQTGLILSQQVPVLKGQVYSGQQIISDTAAVASGSRYAIYLYDANGNQIGVADTGSRATGDSVNPGLAYATYRFTIPASGDSVVHTEGLYGLGDIPILNALDGTPVTLAKDVAAIAIQTGLKSPAGILTRTVILEAVYPPASTIQTVDNAPFTILASDLQGSVLADSETLLVYPVGFDFSYTCDAAGNRFTSSAPPAADAAFRVNNGGTTDCTITVHTDGTLSFSGTGGNFSASGGDILYVLGPVTHDTTLVNPALTLIAHRK